MERGHPPRQIKNAVSNKVYESLMINNSFFPLNNSLIETSPYESFDSYKLIGLILIATILPEPE